MSKEVTLTDLLQELAEQRQFDFRGYKRTTMERRFRKRMFQHNIGSYGEYAAFIRKHADEVDGLLTTLLINVTEFFRDPAAWEILQREMLAPMMRQLKPARGFVLQILSRLLKNAPRCKKQRPQGLNSRRDVRRPQRFPCSLATFKIIIIPETLLQTAYRFVFLLVFLLAWVQPAVAGDPDRSKGDSAEQTDAIFAPLRSNNAPGAAVLVLKDGSTLFRRGYGVTDLRTRHPINAQTNFRLASVTKQFTAMAVMLLVHDGKLNYDDRLADIFPDFPEYGKGISIRNLLNHTSGLQDYEDLMAQPNPTTMPRDAAQSQIPQIQDAGVLELLKQQNTTKFTPGTKWAYSNSGYVVLGLIVARVSGEPFGQFLHDRIFAPLKMNHTLAYKSGQNQVAHRAYGHTKVEKQWLQTDQSPTSATLGDGGAYSSLEDLAKWDAALGSHTLLSEAEMRPALTPVAIPGGSAEEPDGKPAKYGFGWFLNPHQGHARMWHYGETVGFRTSIQRFVDDRLTVIVLCNRSDIEARELALKVAGLYLK